MVGHVDRRRRRGSRRCGNPLPSLALLFSLVLGGRFDPGRETGAEVPIGGNRRVSGNRGFAGRVAAALAVAGTGLLTVASAGWAHALGVACFAGFVVAGMRAVAPAEVAAETEGLSAR
jgi:cytochrome d ubiquinol oxidase subunit II